MLNKIRHFLVKTDEHIKSNIDGKNNSVKIIIKRSSGNMSKSYLTTMNIPRDKERYFINE